MDQELHGSGRTTSPWMKGGVYESRPLEGEIEADVCILGAGFAGLTAAYALAGEGRSVVVLDHGEIGGGESARSTAHLSTALGTRYTELEELHGEPAARIIAESHAAAIDFIERVVKETQLECGFARLSGYLVWPSDADLTGLEAELAACERAGLPVEKVQRAPFGTWNTGPCLRFGHQAQLDPLRYLSGLARAAARRGAKIFTRTQARLLAGETLRLRAENGRVAAKSLVVATNAPMDDGLAFSARQAPYRTYAIAAELPRGVLPELALAWDTVDPYHYVRLAPAVSARSPLLLVGGEDHKVGHAADADERWARLEAWARARFPALGAVTHRWSGQVQETSDGIGFAGRHPADTREVYVVTGDCGNGTTHGTLGGLLVADLIVGRRNDWAGVYDPARFPGGALDLARENLDAAAQYLRYAEAGDVQSVDQIPPGCGAVLGGGLAPKAVYRAPDGALIEKTAVCPHLGGRLCWNQAEGTWDCPVHGSRFSPEGTVLSGPANEPLGQPQSLIGRLPIVRRWEQPRG